MRHPLIANVYVGLGIICAKQRWIADTLRDSRRVCHNCRCGLVDESKFNVKERWSVFELS